MPDQKSSNYPEERRLATVLFADVQGFTSLAEQLDFETVSEMINEIILRLDRVVENHKGYIDKHLGDGVMAVWGAPFAEDNDAEQAIFAGLDMIRVLRDYCATTRIPGAETLKLRVGINSGQVFAGYVGTRREYTVIGDTVNLASRLEKLAEPGTVVIGENTCRMVRNHFRITRLGSTLVKGKAEPIQPYQVELPLAVSGRPRYQHLDSLETNMVGRDKEQELLLRLTGQALGSPRPAMFLLDGDVGIGKSRLLMEWSTYLEQENPSVVVLSTRALAQTSQAPLYLWRVLLRNKFNLQTDDPEELVREKWRDGLAQLWDGDSTPVWVETTQTLETIIGLDQKNQLDTHASLHRIFFVIYEMLRRIGGGKIIILLMEDLQWADRESLQMLQYILNVQETHLRILIAGSARPEFLKTQPQWHNLSRVIHLEPLKYTAEMVSTAYPDLKMLPPIVLEQVGAHADGNPYFLEEIVKSLTKTNLAQDEIEKRLLVNIPESLREILQARLDHLSREARVVALLASVVGRVFWVGAVMAAAQSTPVPGSAPMITIPQQVATRFVQDGLRQLVRAELAFPRAGTRFSDEQEYIFKNSYLRDVAYSLIPNRSRVQYHQAVAQWMNTHRDPIYQSMAREHNRIAESSAKIPTGSLPPLSSLQL